MSQIGSQIGSPTGTGGPTLNCETELLLEVQSVQLMLRRQEKIESVS
jgi:hypothetical protein